LNTGELFAPSAPNVLAAVLDHVEDPAPDAEPELGDDPVVKETGCDAVSMVMAVELHAAL